jgi:MFS family permease
MLGQFNQSGDGAGVTTPAPVATMNNYRILTLINFLTLVAIGISSPLFTLYLQELGATFALISLIITGAMVAMLVSNAAWGWLADWLQARKRLFVAALAGTAIAYFWLSAADNLAMAWLARLLNDISMAGVATLSLALMGDALDASARKGRSMGFSRGLGSLAFAAGAFGGGWLADAWGFGFIFLVCGGFYLTAALVALRLREAPASTPSFSASPVAESRPSGLPLLFLAGVALWTMAHVASTSMWPNYMSALGYSKTAISSLWGLAAVVEMPAMVLSGALSDGIGRAAVLAAGGVGIALVQIGYLLLAVSLPALIGVQIVRGFGFGSYTAAAMTFAAETGGQAQRGRNSGVFNMAGVVGQLAGSLTGGMLVQVAGFHALFILCAGLALGSALCFLWLRRRAPALTAHKWSPG